MSLEFFVEEIRERVRSVIERYGDDREVRGKLDGIVRRSVEAVVEHDPDRYVEYPPIDYVEQVVSSIVRGFEKGAIVFPSVIVLYGPPGTGKTTLARHLARKYFYRDGLLHGLYLEASIGDFSSKYVGVPQRTVRAVLEMVKSRSYPSILLLDEAETLFLAGNTSSGVGLEQARIVAELKSSLSFVTSESYPTVIFLTTNFKEKMTSTDQALLDRITDWVYVPPPPLEVRRLVVQDYLLQSLVMEKEFLYELGENLIRFKLEWRYGTGWVRPVYGRDVSGRLFFPTLPWDADYLLAFTLVYGLNPLNYDFKLTYYDAVNYPWNPDKSVTDIVSDILVMFVELYRKYKELEEGVGKSFMRLKHVVVKGLSEYARDYIRLNKEVYRALEEYFRTGSTSRLEKVLRHRPGEISYKLVRSLVLMELQESLNLHPVELYPLLLSVAANTFKREVIELTVNSLILHKIVLAGIRYSLLPQALVVGGDWEANIIARRESLEEYNKLVDYELRHGRILEPLRTLLTEKDSEKAVRKAFERAGSLPYPFNDYVTLTLIPVALNHKTIHSDIEEKRHHLYRFLRTGVEDTFKLAREHGVDYLLGKIDLEIARNNIVLDPSLTVSSIKHHVYNYDYNLPQIRLPWKHTHQETREKKKITYKPRKRTLLA